MADVGSVDANRQFEDTLKLSSALKSAPGGPDGHTDKNMSLSHGISRLGTSTFLFSSAIAFIFAFAIHIRMFPISSVDRPTQFLQWFVEHGGIHNGVAINLDSSIVAIHDLPVGHEVSSIPISMVVNHDAIMENNVTKLLSISDHFDDISILAVFLAANRQNPDWAPYIAMMQTVTSIPLFYNDDELDLLKGSVVVDMLNDLQTKLNLQFAHLTPHLPDLTIDEYKVFWSLAAFRAFGMHVDDKWESVLIPLFDMATHDPKGGCEVRYDASSNRVILKATLPVKSGMGITTLFQNVSNSLLLFSYGFTLENNDQDVCCRIHFEAKNMVCDLHASMSDEVTHACMAALRGGEKAESIAAESAIMEDMIYAIQNARKAFSSTLEEDDTLLARQSDLSVNQINAIRARRSDKICLNELETLFSGILEIVHDGMSEEAILERFNSWPGVGEYISMLNTLKDTVVDDD
uniref:SET domain-containing protein n=1 Tax=Spongospora subterranea TaxID=70186 RepID=A0A0H5QL03_9EUKA|eukprot:CRZ02795.1 hypothetical protein [Spongospora subterranea]